MSLAPGSRIGPYEIVELIGQGGMGEVYRAHDPRLQRDVAVKTSTQGFDERFEREARAIAALNHPKICHIYDVGPDYLVMELVGGRTLAEIIEKGPIPLAEALRIADQIAEALAAAHEKFITHRDLKPGNIKVTEDGTVKVLDFGLAKFSEAREARGAGGAGGAGRENLTHSPTMSLALTQAGMILGTAAYMSPEQARGKVVDSRSDIWAFGVVLYEMITGRRLFKGEDLTETLASIVKEEPDLSVIPPRVRRLVEACLQKDPKKRLQSIGDRHLLMVEMRPQEPQGQRGWLWPVVAGVATVVAAGLGWTHFRETPPVVHTLRYQLAPAVGSTFVHFQLSPDGHYLAFIARSSGVDRLFVRAMDSLDDREVPGTEGTTYPFWSPDGSRIGFFSQGKLKQVAVGGGPATVIADVPDARGGAWGPNDTIVFAPGVTGTLYRVSASGGAATPMDLPRDGAVGRESLRYPSFLPSSDRFLFTVEADKREAQAVYVGSLDGTRPVRILPDFSATRFVPSPGSRTKGHLLFRRDTTLMAAAFDLASLKVTGEPFPLVSSVSETVNTANAAFTVASNGTLIYLVNDDEQQEREVVWLDRSGKAGKPLVRQKNISSAELSPDGSALVYSLSTQSVTGDLWLLDVARGASQRFTFGPASAFGPLWSPDGASMAFTTYPADQLALKARASAIETPLRVSGTNTYITSWSADGKRLAFSQSSPVSKDDIWLLSLEGDQAPTVFKQTPFDETNGQISPDGRWMVYMSNPSGRYEVYIEPLGGSAGAQRQISVEGGGSPRWRADGRELYFVSDNRMMVVDVKPGPDLAFGAPHELFRGVNVGVRTHTAMFQPSADGSQFLVARRGGDAPAAPPLTVVTNWQGAFGK